MNEYYFNFIKEKMKKDIISKLTQNDNIKNIENIDEIVEKEVNEYFSKNEIILEEENNDNIVQSKTHVYRDRTQYKHRENMCKARVWNCGMGGQCSRKGIIEGFCKGHAEPKNGPGKDDWWLGTIDKPRPREPVNHTGKVHRWVD